MRNSKYFPGPVILSITPTTIRPSYAWFATNLVSERTESGKRESRVHQTIRQPDARTRRTRSVCVFLVIYDHGLRIANEIVPCRSPFVSKSLICRVTGH